eukprot:1150355-Pelagomonas_calceolata.AAC.4
MAHGSAQIGEHALKKRGCAHTIRHCSHRVLRMSKGEAQPKTCLRMIRQHMPLLGSCLSSSDHAHQAGTGTGTGTGDGCTSGTAARLHIRHRHGTAGTGTAAHQAQAQVTAAHQAGTGTGTGADDGCGQ